VHDASKHDLNHFIRECVHLFHNRRLEDHLSLCFCIQFFKLHVNIALQCALASTIERKITLVRDAYSRPPIIIRSHNLCANDIRGVVAKIASFHKGD
jgi:hypothetical protein